KKPSDKKNSFLCIVTDSSRHVRLDIDSLNQKGFESSNLEVKISGLSKYLPNFDSLSANACIDSESQIFHVWKEIEEILVSRSKFFTLIDIYGHYANRGDVVDISVELKNENNSSTEKLINYFGKTKNCGEFICEEELIDKIKLTKFQLKNEVSKLRKMRFDIRTYDTHPIIGSENILCTYPFPLLSKKALVTSKVKLNRDK
ncbi:MAG: hypothetical protein OXE99_13680, partial [Cellvibrionales bacterium]|nr:hypothetical protein [Cellvibrionales bacterium]